jgi:hypothetical protein
MAAPIIENMSNFLSLEDQLDLITKGAAEIVPLEALKERIGKSIANSQGSDLSVACLESGDGTDRRVSSNRSSR